ncbi:DNA-3-methyladenine glycosylase family protein [Marinobacterium rhizophilum]|uniref:DNA-3-methyladenine glycosylase family protein n=1 Tax=Marinobacterium rhizophilum TaxID=420402 RepID=UPI000373B117|nr:DNA-3-methyladenine glycosylase [Marinobacterium rhizophilum]
MAFHRRDHEEVAERVTPCSLTKGLSWDGYPACLTIVFDEYQAEVRLDIDGDCNHPAPVAALLERRVRSMLGLTQPIEEFERQYRQHPQLGVLIQRLPGLRIPLVATPFEALSWAIIGQQISVHAAISIRRRLIRAAGARHSSGLWCYPNAHQISQLDDSSLRAAGLSMSKTRTFRVLCDALGSDGLQLENESCNVEALGAELLQLHGIGPWTVNYALMRGYGWLDASLHGDVAVQRGLAQLLAMPHKPSEAHTKSWLADFSPWRGLVAAHLWAIDVAPRN